MPRRAGQLPQGYVSGVSQPWSRGASAELWCLGASRQKTDTARGINEHGQLFPASWVKGEGKSSQSLEKGEGF